jgi:hypothetical protein
LLAPQANYGTMCVPFSLNDTFKVAVLRMPERERNSDLARDEYRVAHGQFKSPF